MKMHSTKENNEEPNESFRIFLKQRKKRENQEKYLYTIVITEIEKNEYC